MRIVSHQLHVLRESRREIVGEVRLACEDIQPSDEKCGSVAEQSEIGRHYRGQDSARPET